MKKLLVLLISAFLLAACGGGGPRPEPSIYLLRAQDRAPDGPQSSPISIGIGRVSVADYLAHDGIVVATEGDRVRISRQHLWAEPVDSSITLFLRDAVSAELGFPIDGDAAKRLTWRYRVDVRIDEWHGSLDGNGRILASWTVMSVADKKELGQYRLERTATMDRDGYDALLNMQTGLLQSLSAAIAESLRNLGSPDA
jgi:uncharacterized lipoprotein YmbA